MDKTADATKLMDKTADATKRAILFLIDQMLVELLGSLF